MRTRKQFLSIVIVLIFLSSTAYANSCFQSISEIKANTPARWVQTYETPWRTIDIDVEIEVPDVEQFPIIRITGAESVDEAFLVNYEKVLENVPGSLDVLLNGYGIGVGTNETYKYIKYFYNGEVPDLLPEENPLTYQEALDIAYTELARLFGSVTSSLTITETAVFSRYYYYKVENKEKVLLEADPNYTKGKYWIIFSQNFHGIGYQRSMQCYKTLRLGNENNFPTAQILMDIRDANDFDIIAHLNQEVNVVYSDVPILPFADAKAAIEEEIMAGHLRSINTIKLCYAPYTDPDSSDIFWLLPVWYAEGAYTRDATKEFTPYYDSTGIVADSGVSYMEVVYQAQLGTLMDYNDTSRARRKVPKIYTWTDVK